MEQVGILYIKMDRPIKDTAKAGFLLLTSPLILVCMLSKSFREEFK